MDFTVILFVVMLAGVGFAIMRGYPVAFALAGTALLFGLLGIVVANVTGIPIGTLSFGTLSLFTERTFGIMTNEVLLAVPLFVAMGVMLEKSRVAEELLETMGEMFGSIRGGLGISITIVGALLAASTGIVGATVVTMGLISLPTMLKRGYDPALASGSIAAAGTLGQVIPPSIVLVLLGDVLSSSYQEAQREMGIFSPDTVTVGDLFAGAFLPGLGLVVLFIIYQAAMALLRPETSPAMPRDKDHQINAPFFGRLFKALVVPIALIAAVLGSILAGIATPTEAASLGAVGAILLGGLKLAPDKWKRITFSALGLVFLLLQAAFHWFPDGTSWVFLAAFAWGFVESLISAFKQGVLQQVMTSTLKTTTMIFTILLAATMFSLVFRAYGGDDYIESVLTSLPGGVVGAMIVVMLVMFVL
ncbi:MAG TPA: TRAP transporter large permease subunit, partial [Sphingomonadales bacterium]|nr:TRAP transporter large permease subunit [Sphingomonadales bacterium]